MTEEYISLAHGNGGRLTRELIDKVFVQYGQHPLLDTVNDAATMSLPNQTICMTTDSFTVQPLEFPGGNVGSLAVHGTVNDLSVSGATPLYLSTSFIIEEGVSMACLIRVVKAMAEAAHKANVSIVTGDTKVVPKGQGGGIYINTAGIGLKKTHTQFDIKRLSAGDHIVISGPIGDHGVAVLLARDEFGLDSQLISDSASVYPFVEAIDTIDGVKFLRDPTRGGIAMAMHEMAQATNLSIRLNEAAIPLSGQVESVCNMLGFDPYYLACEGRVVAVVAPEVSEEVVRRWQACTHGQNAAIIGEVLPCQEQYHCPVSLVTHIGGERLLDELEDDPLPRIC
ncbi:MAG: hydrogenase expression/formation protein HypE [Cellvibrionaceae bacterium]|nr:hydrogenase expression/formation protein HypE [Cellvibrionaceae bacterium]|tara:strand:- start:2331 stop:3347 length:1017 start_codon:yes stop_codon:yes gene_type:complete